MAQPQRNRWYERIMAMVAVANLGLVAFDASYVPWRNFWWQRTLTIGPIELPLPLPNLTPLYDPIKGIEPHRDTDRYLKTLDQLNGELQQNSIDSTVVQARLEDLRHQSGEMISSNPFSAANKSGTLEKIKNRLRDRVYGRENSNRSSRQAFETFWSVDYLKQKGVEAELAFFNRDVRRLIETNYFRAIGENGEPTNYFFLLDAPFIALFGFELFWRTLFLSRRRRIKWLDAILWRWYDVLFLLPIGQFLRVIPTLIRLDQAQLIRLSHVQDQMTRGFVSTIAEELTQTVLTQAVTQVQTSLKRGDLAQRLLKMVDQPYQDLNDKDELQAVVSQVLQLTVQQVLPKIQPDLEAVLRHPIEAVLDQTPGYGLFKSVPLLGNVPQQVNQQMVATATSVAYQAIVLALEDKVAAELISQLIRNFGQVFAQSLQEGKTLDELQTLLNELLEEVKVNYLDNVQPSRPLPGDDATMVVYRQN
jgi:hypothetical protein